MKHLPAAARVSCWVNAWLAGRESADAVISGLAGGRGGVEFVGPAPGSRLPAALLLAELRRWQVRRASCALPAPGDPLGLGGPAEFNAEVLDAAEGVVLHGSELGLVLQRGGSVTSWRVTQASPPSYLPHVAEASRNLRAALTATADALADLDVASWQPDVADSLTELRRGPRRVEHLPFASAECARLASDALRAAGIVSLAQRDETGPVSAWESERRSGAMRPLEQATRAALVAATSSYDGS